jgi:spermine/spermidine synthase
MSRPRLGSPELRLVLVSFLILFLEISLIRYLSTEIRIFAYVNNLVLLACFLGMGLGCCRADSEAPLTLTSASLAVTLLLLALPLRVPFQGKPLHPFRDAPTLLSVFSDSPIWYEFRSGNEVLATMAGLSATLVIFLLVLIAFVPLGRRLGGLMDAHPRVVRAYSINVAAGLAGLWLFGILSFASLPPWVWFAMTGISLALLARPSIQEGIPLAGLAAAIIVMVLAPGENSQRTLWSPYQKLELKRLVAGGIDRGYLLNVNNVGYMALLNLSDAFIAQWPDKLDASRRAFGQYDLPYRIQKGARDVLIVGAGGGNDVAGALRHGAQHVTAVEIDPGIIRLGREYHPEAPYGDARVQVVVDDARAFFRRDRQHYDLISFGLLDAHAQASSYNNTRVDHYVYTVESFREARERLDDLGILTVSFESPRPWITGRIGANLREAFGEEPVAFRIPAGSYGWGGTLFIVARDPQRLRTLIHNDLEVARFIAEHPATLEPPRCLSSDDWPYLYLESRSIPRLHLCLSGILLLFFALLFRGAISGERRLSLHFFFLGAAFLLLEFQNISKSALLFGSTWLVSSITISAILVLILLANLVSSRFSLPAGAVYGCLLAAILAAYLVPLEWFNDFDLPARGVLAGGLLNLPIFFAGLVFIGSFRRTEDRGLALGSNLLGAGVGGILESLSFITGIRALLLMVAGLYMLSWASRRRL